MRRSRYFLTLCSAAVLAVPLLAGGAPGFPEDSLVYRDEVMTGPGGPWSAALPADDGGLLEENGVPTALGTLIDPASGRTITDDAAVSDLQRIAGRACRAGTCQAVTLNLVSCVPEPPMAALLAAGLALGLARGKGGFRLPVRRRRG